MKKLLLLVGLIVFLASSLVYGASHNEKEKKCMLDNLLEIDNDGASRQIEKACEWLQWNNQSAINEGKCILKNIHKASEKNNQAARRIGKACEWLQWESQSAIDEGRCILNNIAKAKSDGSAKNIARICE